MKEAIANMGPTWEASRMVSYHQSVARMTLTPSKDAADPAPGGSIFLQSFQLSDGTPCLKANLSWEGSTESTTVAVYSKPELNWRAEAGRIASRWISGPQTRSAEIASMEVASTPAARSSGMDLPDLESAAG